MEIEFMTVVRLVTKGWRWLTCGALVGLALAILLLRVMTPLYTVDMKVYSSKVLDQGLLGAKRFPLEAAFMNASGPGDEEGDIFKQFLVSRQAVSKLEDQTHVMERFYRSEWDPVSKKWVPPSGILFFVKSFIDEVIGRPAWRPPSIYTFQQYLAKSITVDTPFRSSVMRISLTLGNRKLAMQILTGLYRDANELLRSQMEDRARVEVAYLTRALKTVTESSRRETLVNLLLMRENQLALARKGASPQFLYIDPPVPPQIPTSPRPLLYLVGGFLLGILFGISKVVLPHALGAARSRGISTDSSHSTQKIGSGPSSGIPRPPVTQP